MRTIRTKHQEGDDFDAMVEEMEQFDVAVEWKDGPDAVLEAVDDLLKKHGLEVVTPDECGADMYFFSIQRRGLGARRAK